MKQTKIWMSLCALLMMMAGASQLTYAHGHHKGNGDDHAANSKSATKNTESDEVKAVLASLLVKDSGATPESRKLSSLIDKEKHDSALSAAVTSLYGSILFFYSDLPGCAACQCDHSSHPTQCGSPCTEVGNHYCNV